MSTYGYQHDFYTPELITKRSDLPPNGVMVGGVNPQGRHGKGAALAMKLHFGAIYGQAEGLKGDSYGVITKELRPDYPAITLKQVYNGVIRMLACAQRTPDRVFYVTKLGTQLAYFTVEQIGDIFRALMPLMPINVILPKEFT